MKTPYSQPALPNQGPPPTGLGLYSSKDYDSRLGFWLLVAAGAHVGTLVFAWLLVTILMFFGWNIPMFQSQLKTRDVEFVLVDNSPPAQPRKPTNKKAEHASRSGGQKIANQPEQMPQRAAGAPSKPAVSRPSVQPRPQTRPQPQRQQPQRQQQATQRPTQQAPTPKPTQRQAPAPKVPRPTQVASAQPSMPPNPIAPTIKTPAPPNPSMSGSGPIVKTPDSGSSSGGSSGSSSPGPSMIAGNPSRASSGSPGSAGSRGGRGGSGGTGSYNQSGSPGGGGGRAGIDAMAEPDFGPYIAELQRRIRRNWAPPTDDRSKRVVALFKISRDGRLISLRIVQSSGSAPADQAAMAAVRASAPFRPLPPNFRDDSIDVQFIFDYEIYGHGNAQMR